MPIAGTMQTYDQVGRREDLTDVISNISPTDTPFFSGCSKGTVKQTLHEWQTDELAAADTGNARVQGRDATFSKPAATVRVGNYTQISDKTLILSETAEVVNKAGRKSEIALQMAKRGKELKRDIEAILLANQAGNAGAAAVAPTLAGLPTWVQSNVNLNTAGTPAGANSGHTTGVPSATRTDSSAQRVFTEDMLIDVTEQIWNEGGEGRVLMVGGFNKRKVSGFSGIATRNFDLSKLKPTAIIASADVYVGDFATLRVMPNRFQRARDAWVLDFEYLEVAWLRRIKVEKLAKTGDAQKRLMVGEYTLVVKNEAAIGMIADLTTA